jgi:hypothetical protein
MLVETNRLVAEVALHSVRPLDEGVTIVRAPPQLPPYPYSSGDTLNLRPHIP